MNKLFLIKNPDLFQGEKYLNKGKNYFEGWYFKNSIENDSISFIPGINIENGIKKAFIQVITNNTSHYINYNINDFQYSFLPFSIRVGKSTFSKDGMHIDIKEDNIYGDIMYTNNKNIITNILKPNIMGPFSYVPYMECNHAILSMQNDINGLIHIRNKELNFKNGTGYIEKDWGVSFPKSYIWCQGNSFQKSNVSFMLSVADVPFKNFSFKGVICAIIIGNNEYKFTTYNGTKLLEYSVTPFLNITLKKGKYILNISSKCSDGQKLVAPSKGSMNKNIIESITAKITVTLKENNDIIFSDTSTNCGLEIV